MLQTRLLSGISLAIVLAAPAFSQFLLRVDVNGQTSPVANGGTVAMNAPGVGQAVSATLTLTYIGSSSASLDAAPQIFGAGDFTASAPTALTLAPAQSTSVTLQFTPKQVSSSQSVLTWLFKEGSSTTYEVLSLSLAGSVPSVVVSAVQSNGNYAVVAPGGTWAFPDTLVSANSDQVIAITNRGSGTGVLTSIAVSGDAYQLMGLPLFPVTLAAGGELRVTLRFLPKSSGAQSGTLQVGSSGGVYSIALQGSALGAFFDYNFSGASGTLEPFTQPGVGLSLTEPYGEDIKGTLTLATATNLFSPDPAVQFSSGGTKVAFTIPAGSLKAVFPSGSAQVFLQTGTVAEFITITPAFASAAGTDLTPKSVKTVQIEVPRRAPVLLDASIASITTTGFTVTVTGYSTTRSLNQLSFQFKPASGVSIPSAATNVDVSSAAAFWYSGSTAQSLGGLFSIDIPFTITGDSGSTLKKGISSFISGIGISASNVVGTSEVALVTFP